MMPFTFSEKKNSLPPVYPFGYAQGEERQGFLECFQNAVQEKRERERESERERERERENASRSRLLVSSLTRLGKEQKQWERSRSNTLAAR